MEGKSGFDVAAYLRNHCRTPFMFLSAFSDEQTVAQVEALGAVAYLVKPLDIAADRAGGRGGDRAAAQRSARPVRAAPSAAARRDRSLPAVA